jgi:predicted HicB family RNase H-like nuclease
MLGEDINATERLINCVVIYKDETSKIKTISLRIDSDLHEKLQAKLKPGVSLSDYIRSLIEKDIKQ